MVRGSGCVSSMRILSSRRTKIFPDSVDLSLTTTVTFVRSKSAVRLWKSPAWMSSCFRTLSSVPLYCWDELQPVNAENAAIAAAAQTKTVLLNTLDTLIQPTSPLIRVARTHSTVMRIQNRAARVRALPIYPESRRGARRKSYHTALRCYGRFRGYAFQEALSLRISSIFFRYQLLVSFCMIVIPCSTVKNFACVCPLAHWCSVGAH